MWPFNRAPDLRLGPATKPYLKRWHLLKTKWFSIYLHHMPDGDPGAHAHDHPADNLSIVLRGGYVETRIWAINPHPVQVDRGNGGITTETIVDAFHATKNFVTGVQFRRAEEIHHIHDVRPNTWTLWIKFKDRRDWGFWLPNGYFVPWRDYVGVADAGVARDDLAEYLHARFMPQHPPGGPKSPFPPPPGDDPVRDAVQVAFNKHRRDIH